MCDNVGNLFFAKLQILWAYYNLKFYNIKVKIYGLGSDIAYRNTRLHGCMHTYIILG